MNKNKRNNFFSVALVFLLVAAIGFLFGTIIKNLSNEKNENNSAEFNTPTSDTAIYVSSTLSAETSSISTTESQSLTQTTQSCIEAENTASTQHYTEAPTVDAVCATYNNAVNSLKQYTGSITVHKDEKIRMEITEFSLPAPTEQINSVMRSIVPDTLEDYTFRNGVRTDEPETKVTDTIPPFGESAAVSSANVSSATIADIDGGQEITLKLIPETASFDGSVTTPTPNISSVLDELDFATFDMDPIGVQNAEISYSEVTLTASLDSSGRLTKLLIGLPVIVACTGGMSVFTADVVLDMEVTTIYEISYQ